MFPRPRTWDNRARNPEMAQAATDQSRWLANADRECTGWELVNVNVAWLQRSWRATPIYIALSAYPLTSIMGTDLCVVVIATPRIILRTNSKVGVIKLMYAAIDSTCAKALGKNRASEGGYSENEENAESQWI